MNSRDIDRTGIHEGRMLIESATRYKDYFEMLLISMHGGKPEESEHYAKYFRREEEPESEEDDAKHLAQMMKFIEGLKRGRQKNTGRSGA